MTNKGEHLRTEIASGFVLKGTGRGSVNEWTVRGLSVANWFRNVLRQPLGHKVTIISDYFRNNAENNKQWQDLQLLQDKNLGYSYGNNPLDDSGLGGMIPNGMDESVQNVSTYKPKFRGRSCLW